jgi:hypothetical protein
MATNDVGFWDGIARELGGKGQLRMIVQPAMAVFFGVRLGLADAREHQAPFVIRLFRTAPGGTSFIRQALSDVIVPFCIAVIIDSILQYTTLGRVRPLAALIVGALLVWLPYAAARGLTNRIVDRRGARDEADAPR